MVLSFLCWDQRQASWKMAERKKGEEDKRQGGSGVPTALWQGWAFWAWWWQSVLQKPRSWLAKSHSCWGLGVGFVWSLRILLTYSFRGLEVWEPAFHKEEGNKSSGGLTFSRWCPNPVAGFTEVCQSIALGLGLESLWNSTSRAGLSSLGTHLGPDHPLQRVTYFDTTAMTLYSASSSF